MNFALTDTRMLPTHEWDVIVIGAGVAGSVAARQFAQHGLSTMLIEARAFPRPKVCGGCLNSRAIHGLQQIGLSQLIQDLRGETFDGICLKSGKSTAFLTLPGGISVSRQSLDMALMEAAHRAGAFIVTEASAAVLPETDGETRQINLTCRGRLFSVRSRVVVCAEGLLRSSLNALPQMRASHSANSRVGVGAVLDPQVWNDSVIDQVPHHRITMIVERHGYVGLTWAEEGRLSVAGALDPHFVKTTGSPEAAINEILAPHGIHFSKQAGWHGTPSLTVSPHQNAAERIFVIGDAAGYVEPFTGEGMAAAVEEAISVTHLVCQAVANWRPSLAESWQRQHRLQFQKRQRICRLASSILRRPWLSRLAMTAMRTFPQPANYLVSCIARPTLAFPQG